MGLILRRWKDYLFKDELYHIKFLRDVPVYNVPPAVEQKLMNTGYFHYTPDKDRPIPESVTRSQVNATPAATASTDDRKQEKYKNMREQLEKMKMKNVEEVKKKEVILDETGAHEVGEEVKEEKAEEYKPGEIDVDLTEESLAEVKKDFLTEESNAMLILQKLGLPEDAISEYAGVATEIRSTSAENLTIEEACKRAKAEFDTEQKKLAGRPQKRKYTKKGS